jgi:NTE family protein
MPTRLSLAFALSLASLCATAQPAEAGSAPQAGEPSGQRPRVALVLSGGGARGGAHIGVLKVLEALRVPVDMIVGTSAGAIVGAAYATGLPLATIESEMQGLSTATLFRDVVRDSLPPERKADDAVNYVGPEMGLGAHGLSLPKGAVAGVALEAVLRRLTARQHDVDFDRFPLPFRAIATDLATSEMVVLDRGSLAQAVRASMAIPAVISPVELDGRLLVDGGVTRNLPVDVARRMGADVVIAVNIGTPLLRREDITSLLSASEQMLRILTATNVAQSLKELGPRDVLITPDLSRVSSSDFDHLLDAAQAGEAAARDASPALAAYRIGDAEYAALMTARNARQESGGQRIAEVRVTGTQRVNPQTVIDNLRTRAGDTFDAGHVDRDLQRLYGSGDFEAVSYTFSEEPGTGYVLTTSVTEKSWGPNYLRFGLGLSSDFAGSSFFNLLATHRATWLNSLGAEWRNDLQIGRTDRLRTEWYQPLHSAHRFFVAAHAAGERSPFELFDGEGTRFARFRLQHAGYGADLGLQLGTAGDLRLGVRRGRVRLQNDTSLLPPGLFESDADTAALVLRLRLDTLDNVRFPRTGYALDVKLHQSQTGWGAKDDFRKLSAAFRTAVGVGRHALEFALQGVKVYGSTLPPYEASFLGGFQRLSGYKTNEVVGDEFLLARVNYSHRLTAVGFLDGAYAGLSLEAARIGETAFGPQRDKGRYGLAIYLAMDTPLGPVYLALGRGDSRRHAAYFYLGQP